jgi:hypothetical protein
MAENQSGELAAESECGGSHYPASLSSQKVQVRILPLWTLIAYGLGVFTLKTPNPKHQHDTSSGKCSPLKL